MLHVNVPWGGFDTAILVGYFVLMIGIGLRSVSYTHLDVYKRQPMSNAMFALKCGNAIIITPHHSSIKCSTETVNMINRELSKLGYPDDLIQTVSYTHLQGSYRYGR